MQSVPDNFLGITPVIKLVLTLSGEKVKKGKLMEPFQMNFAMYVAVNIENGVDIIPFLETGKIPSNHLSTKDPRS